MKLRYLIMILVVIAIYFKIATSYMHIDLPIDTSEVETLRLETALVFHEIDSVIDDIKQISLQDHEITILPPKLYTPRSTKINAHPVIIYKDSIIINSIIQDSVLPVIVYDTVIIPIVIPDTIYTPMVSHVSDVRPKRRLRLFCR